jgi:hypothetical protein
VSDPAEQLSKLTMSENSKQNSKILKSMKQGPIWGRFVKNNQRPKISCYCPFNVLQTSTVKWVTFYFFGDS